METIQFTKMQGIGNDYIYIDCHERVPRNLASLAREMSDRHYGVGGDGIILIMPSSEADFKMRIFNADGTEARMCGNGARCVAKYVYDNKLTYQHHITLETLSGVKHLFLKPGSDGFVETVTVDMGLPSLLTKEIPVETTFETFVAQPVHINHLNNDVYITAVSMGNPHAVVFIDNVEDFDISIWGPAIEHHTLFPDRVNVEFVQVINRNEIRMRVWERGSGVTKACGTGACASVVAAVTNGLCDNKVRVILDGGGLMVEIDDTNGHVMMTGSATTVFVGQYVRKSV